MTLPWKQETVVEIDGIEFKLVFEIKAIIEAERILGKSLILGLTPQMIDSPTVDEVCGMFFAAAKARQPDLTLDMVEQLVGGRDFKQSSITLVKMRNGVLEAWLAGAVEQTDGADGSTVGEAKGQG